MTLTDEKSKMRLSAEFIILAFIVTLAGCSQQSAERTRYDMQKLAFAAEKLSEQINIQPTLSTAADSLNLKSAYRAIVDYFSLHRSDAMVAADTVVLRDMAAIARSAEFRIANYYRLRRQGDSVLASYRRIADDLIPTREHHAEASLGIALTYRSLENYDSTIRIYDRILTEYYPPLDMQNRVNSDVIALPVDKIKIAKAIYDDRQVNRIIIEALTYYADLKESFPDQPHLGRVAAVETSRVYAMNQRWDDAITELRRLTDSTGKIQIRPAMLIANIYDGAVSDPDRAIAAYKDVIERRPDSAIIGECLLRISAALCSQEKFDDGRRYLADLKRKFERSPALMAQAQLYYAQSFRDEGRWERALSEFQWLLDNYPYSEEAFRIARYIPEHFARDGQTKLADIWFDRAIEFYQRAAENKRNQPVAIAAYTYLADTYRRLNRWDDALETLDQIANLAPHTRVGARALYDAASLTYHHLGDSLRAQTYLDRLNRDFGTTDSARIHQEETTNFNIESFD